MDVVQSSSVQSYSSSNAEDVSIKLSTLIDIFPRANFEFLRTKAIEFSGQTEEAFAIFIEELITHGNYPTEGDSRSSSSTSLSSSSSNATTSTFDPYANPKPSTSKDVLKMDIAEMEANANQSSNDDFMDLMEPFDVVRFMERYEQNPFPYFEQLPRDEVHGLCVAAYLKDSSNTFDPYANPTPSTSKVDPVDAQWLERSNEGPSSDVEEIYDLTEPFNVVRFMERYSQDPFKYFKELKRDVKHELCVAAYLKDRFKTITASFIETEVVLNGGNLLKTADSLLNPLPSQLMDKPRTTDEMDKIEHTPVSFLREVEFYEHKQDILDYMEMKLLSRQVAKQEGGLMTCECCSEDEILPQEVMICSDGHIFCRECIRRYVEVRIGDGATVFPCLQGCPAQIPFKYIESVLPPEASAKLMARIQEDEIHQAAMSDVEFCCACEYGVIPAPSDLVLHCIKCGVETCRACKKRTHVPFKCGETETDDQIKQDRKKAEETLTMRILRKCPKCRLPFVKSSGCDKITCTCGSTICHRCGLGGIDYNHFAVCPTNANNSPWSRDS